MEMEDRPDSKESFTTDGLRSIIGTARTDHCPASLTPVCGESASEDEVADELRFHEILNMAADPHYSSPHSPSPQNPSFNDPYSVAVSFMRDAPAADQSRYDSSADEEVKLEIAGTQLNRDFMHLDFNPVENLMPGFFHHQKPPHEPNLEEVLASSDEDAQLSPRPTTLERRHTLDAQNDAGSLPYLGGYVDKRTAVTFPRSSAQNHINENGDGGLFGRQRIVHN